MPFTFKSAASKEAMGYLDSHLVGETPVMARIRATCEREDLPAVSPHSGRLLATLAAASRAERVLEVGCLLGYSALWFLHARPTLRVDTIEADAMNAAAAEANFREAGVAERVRVHRGLALDVLPTLQGPYDLMFLDAAKEEMLEYLEHARRLLRPGGVLAADNVLWSGRVWDARAQDADTVGIRRFTEAIVSNPGMRTSIIPIGDGLSLSVMPD